MSENVMSILASELSRTASIDVNHINQESHLKDDLGIDSLDLVDITVQLETLFDVQFKPKDLDKIKTVGDLLEKLIFLLPADH